MDFPSLMPKELSSYLGIKSEEELLVAFIQKPNDLVLFFETASDDETWTENNEGLMRKLLSWLTLQTFHDHLSKINYQKAALAVQKHHLILKSMLPENITIKLKDDKIPFNGLLLAAASDFFRQILLNESRFKDSDVLSFPQLTANEFAPIGSFIVTGQVPDLRTKGQDEIIELIKRANAWELSLLSLQCETMLPKYLTVDNVFELLALAKNERWGTFERACTAFINSHEWKFSLFAPTFERLAFEFFDFTDPTLEYFERLRPLITDIVCSGALTEEPQFGFILKSCPDLYSLDISRTFAFSNQLEEIPGKLQILNVSSCPWISKETIKRLFDFTPDLRQLLLQNNVHLNYMFWGELAKYNRLIKLDMANCTQFQDSDLSLILRGIGSLTELSLSNCKKIDENGFLELAKRLSRLIRLNLSRSNLSDTALVEIISRCRYLTTLDISACLRVTEKGILSVVKNALSLQELDISRCVVSADTLEEIKKTAPLLQLIKQD
ncbi:MAG TPA: BTB/POZ domain-containing protein [Parachlamydiaceae bacterium]|nr:BTB/POZ domain-containing protein [Parachlamydiaceae bacterium]